MPGTVSFTIKGGKEMEALLKDLGPKIASRLGDKALMAAARVIVKEAKRRVPVKTGQLKKSISAVRSSRNRAADERLVQIGFKPPVSARAHFTEFGTAHSRPEPFIRPALDSQAEEALRAMVEALATGIEREEYKQALASGVDIPGLD